ncbi:MAG TPA: hypothetical protein VGX37_09420 [Allosphingosinicella sp.]|nr:hypothetical protein [Allosphingosinicella sp.]
MKPWLGLAATAALAGCSTAPGVGWSRAPDLSVYSAMTLFGDIARNQSVLCSGFGSAGVERHWRGDFAAREAAVAAALAARHGAEAVDRAEAAAVATQTVSCPGVPNDHWRVQYVRMLRLLETRLGLA